MLVTRRMLLKRAISFGVTVWGNGPDPGSHGGELVYGVKKSY